MDEQQTILNLFDDYFKSAPKSEVETDVKYINALGTGGMSYEDYLQNLNVVTAYSLMETGICDDIAYADLFNKSMGKVKMGDISKVTVLTEIAVNAYLPIPTQTFAAKAGESNYAMAA